MTSKELAALVRGIAGPLKTRFHQQSTRTDSIEQRLAALETRPTLKYGGPWRADGSYSEGALVTRHGGLWLASAMPKGQPGSADSGWLLVVKSGQAT